MRRTIFDEVHDDFRTTARAFFERECAPNAEKWKREGTVSREAWAAAGEHGLIGWALPEMNGGYSYINEYEIARLWHDARVQRIYGGTTEIMKDLMGRSMGF